MPASGRTAILMVGETVTGGLVLGSVATFALALLAALLLEENVVTLPGARLTDSLLRMLLGLGLLAGGFGLGIVFGLLRVLLSFAVHRDLVDAAATDPDVVPVSAQRRVAAARYSRVGTGATVLALVGGILLVCGLAAAAMFLAEGRSGGGWVLALCAAFAIPTAVGIALHRWLAHRGEADIPANGDPERIRRAEEAALAVAASQPTEPPRPRAFGVRLADGLQWAGSSAVGVALIAATIAAVMRQPCRTCRPRTWGSIGEWVIDQGLIVAGMALVVAVLIGTAGMLLALVASRRERADLLARADAHAARPDPVLLRLYLTTSSPVIGLARTLAAWCAGFAWLAIALAVAGQGWAWCAALAAVLLVVASWLAWWDLLAGEDAERRLRAAWPIVDADPEPEADAEG